MNEGVIGQDSDQRISLRVTDLLLEQFDDMVDESGAYASRSDAIRAAMKEMLDDDPAEGLPRVAPNEPQLAHGYERLCMAANTNGIIPGSTARRVTAGGPNQLSKTETGDLVLKPLQRRGYIGRSSNIYGDESYRVHGLDEQRSAAVADGGETDAE